MFQTLTFPDQRMLARAILPRTQKAAAHLEEDVAKAYACVEEGAEAAILEYTRTYDSKNFAAESVFITPADVEGAIRGLTPRLSSAVHTAVNNISAVNRRIMNSLENWTMKLAPDHTVGETVTPLDTALVWVPARKAPLISTAVMLCVAAAEAGVRRIILGTPPTVDGTPNLDTIAAGSIAGATEFVCGNGLAVIAAAATGNWRYSKVNAILGPGPPAIALAMHQSAKYGVVTQPGIGPSDALILFEGPLDAEKASLLARNFLTEIEHGQDSYTYALTTDAEAAEALREALYNRITQIPEYFDHYSGLADRLQAAIIVFQEEEDLIAFTNDFAPEHLCLFMEASSSNRYIHMIHTAGEILEGYYTPFAAANYCVGVTAVLPTNGFARSYSGITSRNFVRFTSTARLERSALQRLYPTIEALGEAERLPNHAAGARME